MHMPFVSPHGSTGRVKGAEGAAPRGPTRGDLVPDDVFRFQPADPLTVQPPAPREPAEWRALEPFEPLEFDVAAVDETVFGLEPPSTDPDVWEA